MRGAIRFHRPTRQQQTQNDTENELFLPRQPFHAHNLAQKGRFGKKSIYDLRLAIYD